LTKIKTRSFNIWIPLTDVTIENGAVFVLPGSHSKIESFRGPGIPSLFKNIEQAAWHTLTPLPMKVGEARFYDHALLHGSPANTSSNIRLGIVCGVMATGADMQLCFQKNNQVDIYKAGAHFFMEKNPANGPEGLAFLKSITPEHTVLSLEDYQTIFAGKSPVQICFLWDGNHFYIQVFAAQNSAFVHESTATAYGAPL
jgi:hypothetical protein